MAEARASGASAARAGTPPAAVTDIVEINNRFYVLASSSLADENDRVLKQGETFAVFDQYGDVKPVGLGEEGIYHQGTRYLSGLLLRLGTDRPLLLGSAVRDDNALVAVDLTNPDIGVDGQVSVPRGALHVERTIVLREAFCHERLIVRNFGLTRVALPLFVWFQADYADIFEVRGVRRQRTGQQAEPLLEDAAVTLAYRGLDGRERRTRLAFSPAPSELGGGEARFDLDLEPGQEMTVEVAIGCEIDDRRPTATGFGDTLHRATLEVRDIASASTGLSSSNELFDGWLERSMADVSMMTTTTPHGPYPYAGVPWFSAPFGRDGIVTALECLAVAPQIARGVLRYLAATQAQTVDPQHDAEPGKILHETRLGEMAELGEIPFGCYYGSVDSTPLFVGLAGAYYRRTADLALVRELWPSVERALAWIDRYGDADGDGFIEYSRQSANGLEQQGWKDSFDSVFHADGSLADGPIALCEVQGYAYAAWRAAAELARALGEATRASELAGRARELRRRFDGAFWLDDLGTYAIALDGDKRPCRVRSSNAGQCLASGIVAPERAERLIQSLLTDASSSGWGIRTIAVGTARYNPMSYHNGSVWPHDNALIALGFARYGAQPAAARLLGQLFDAARSFELTRLPELFCGFRRRQGEGPVRYPVACSPQAWAAGAAFLLLQASLGLEIDAPNGQVRFNHARLPAFVGELRIDGLQVGDASVDLLLRRHAEGVGIDVVRREGPIEILARQ